MSLGARATKGGGRAGKEGKAHAHDKGGKGTDKPQPKEKLKPQATTEQLRMAHMIDRKSEDASDVRRMVLDLMEMTCRTEEEVCSALHDADNDMQAACNLLLEDTARIQGEWQTREKKKKKPAVTVGNGEVEPPPRDPRSRSGPRSRRGEGEGGGRGRGSGRGRGGRVGRAGRGGRRLPPPRLSDGSNWQPDGDNIGGNIGDSFPQAEDWDNEEWSGSLSDTKVFTPSTAVAPGADDIPQANNAVEDWDTPAETNNGHSEPHIPTYTYHNATRAPPAPSQSVVPAASGVGHASPAANSEPPIDVYHSPTQHQPMGMSGSLSAAQSQYLSQLTQQSQRHDNSVYTSNYGVYGAADITRKPQRARVPPPSKIPVSAVEMPGGAEPGIGFLDVQFGALEPGALRDTPPPKQQVTSQADSAAAPAHEPPEPAAAAAYPSANTMLSESLSAETVAAAQPQPSAEPSAAAATNSLEKQLTSSMKQLSVSGASPPAAQHHNYTPRQKVTAASYLPAHTAAHHVPYQPPVYAPQVNSTNAASLTGAPAMSAAGYPSSVTMSQYQPMLNSYQQQQTSSSAGVYGGAALYTPAPYTYQPHNKLPAKDAQYDSAVASSNSLTNTSTTQTSSAKVTATTASSAASVAAYAVQANPAALYGQQPATTYQYDETCLRPSLPHHIGGYYEVGYGVSGGREGTFGLGAGERFGRADAASPQQVPAALPPGYAYFYQPPPPNTYQYGVYPPYGGGSNVGGVGGVGGVGSVTAAGKVSTYTQQQPQYEQDTYKAAGGYSAGASKSAGGAAAELTSAMYANKHQALNKLNSYEKATFHSGTPPPFGAGSHHMYIAAPPHHHHHHQLQHQMDVRVNSSQNRRESAGGGAGAGAGGGRGAGKPSATKPYSQSYWPPN